MAEPGRDGWRVGMACVLTLVNPMPGTQCRRSSRVPLQVFPFPLTEQKKHPRNSYNMEKATPSEVGRRGVGGLPLLFVLSYSTSREEQKSGRHDLDFHLNHLFESYPEFS